MFKKLLIIVLFALPFCAFAQTPQFKCKYYGNFFCYARTGSCTERI